MSSTQSIRIRIQSFIAILQQSLRGEEQDYTQGSIRRALIMLAIPMILEMMMESIFAVVDIFFISKLGEDAVSTVGLTESFLTIIYSAAIGLSMAATAMVARRIGEKNPEDAGKAGMQAILLSLMIAAVLTFAGVFFSRDILSFMGASPLVIETGLHYTQAVFASSTIIILLFLINGIFRGAGDASIAMRSLWIANLGNIIFCPLLIYGLGSWEGLGLIGAAYATILGRGIGVLYQLFHLFSGKRVIKMLRQHLIPDWRLIGSLLKIASTATVQFLIASASWIVLSKFIARFGSSAIAGYTIALRIVMFFLLPAWGMSNAAATLVGQNLGAGEAKRAEDSVWRAAKYNAVFMFSVSLIFLVFSSQIVGFMTKDAVLIGIAKESLHIISLGYVFFGVGMVFTSSFNGAGDTKTPTWINLIGFWVLQVPLAWLLAIGLHFGPKGVYITIIATEAFTSILGIIIFRRGRWKLVKI